MHKLELNTYKYLTIIKNDIAKCMDSNTEGTKHYEYCPVFCAKSFYSLTKCICITTIEPCV